MSRLSVAKWLGLRRTQKAAAQPTCIQIGETYALLPRAHQSKVELLRVEDDDTVIVRRLKTGEVFAVPRADLILDVSATARILQEGGLA